MGTCSEGMREQLFTVIAFHFAVFVLLAKAQKPMRASPKGSRNDSVHTCCKSSLRCPCVAEVVPLRPIHTSHARSLHSDIISEAHSLTPVQVAVQLARSEAVVHCVTVLPGSAAAESCCEHGFHEKDERRLQQARRDPNGRSGSALSAPSSHHPLA